MNSWLFDRIFRQPPTRDVLPEENLVTEITAFFLEHFPVFRERLLTAIQIGHGAEDWTVLTQKQLSGPGQPWHDMVPDITLIRETDRLKIFIEVKIDALPTQDRQGRPQTCAYADYLLDERSRGLASDTRLVALTRWRPEVTFSSPCDRVVRFGELTAWLDAAAAASPGSMMAGLSVQWADYIRRRRWVMRPITKQHLTALRQVDDLTSGLWEVLRASNERVTGTKRWQAMPGSKPSESEYPEGVAGRSGRTLWLPKMALVNQPLGHVQIGCFYGEEHGQVAIRPIIWIHTDYLSRLAPNLADKLEPPWFRDDGGPSSKIVWLDDLAAHVEEPDVWDRMQESIAGALADMS